jgi:hypothetical protein
MESMFDRDTYARCLALLALAGSVSLFAALPARSQEETMAPEMARTATCMVDVLRTTPGFMDVKVTSIDNSDREILVSYDLRVPSGQVFHRRVEVYQDGPSRFSIYMLEGLTSALSDGWRTCGQMTVQPIS